MWDSFSIPHLLTKITIGVISQSTKEPKWSRRIDYSNWRLSGTWIIGWRRNSLSSIYSRSICSVKKWKIPNKIGLASQMSKVRIWLIIDQESGNQPRKNKRKAKRKLEEPQEELFLYVCYPQVGERPCSTFYVILRYTREYSLVFTMWWIVAESTIS